MTRIPSRIADYEVQRELARGGMGVVYEVRRPNDPRRLVLKMILEPDPTFVERFARETQTHGFLSRHPHVVDVSDAGNYAGQAYLVMPLIEGGSLADRLERGETHPRESIPLLGQIARALHFAHEAGVIHRDVKPSNILIDDAGQAQLADFGVAKNLQLERMTKTGALVGTPEYMAPEQLEGDRAVDRRADVYALGAVLYEVLTGRRPFTGSQISLMSQIFEKPPPPPGELMPDDVPADVAAVCLKALEKDPNDRQPTAAAFAHELEEAFYNPGSSERGGHPARYLVAGALGALLGTGATWALTRPSAARQPVPEPTPVKVAQPAPSLAERAAAVEKALAVEPERILITSSDDAATLYRAARNALQAVKPEDPQAASAVARARRRLFLARLLDPQRDMRPACLHLARLSRSANPAVATAARPWTQGFHAMEKIDELFAADPLPKRSYLVHYDQERGLRRNGKGTWPPGWLEALQAARTREVDDTFTAEAVLWHPELTFLFFHLGFLGRNGRMNHVTGRCLTITAQRQPSSREALFWLTRYRMRSGEFVTALRSARRCLQLNETLREKGTFNPWQVALVARVLISQRNAAQAREALEILDRFKVKRKLSRLTYWTTRALAHRVLGELEKARECEKRAGTSF